MTAAFLLGEFLAALYFILPWYAAMVLLRGLLWLSPLRFLSLQRLLFHGTEPAVRRIRDAFDLPLRRWDPSIPVAALVILLFWSTALRGGLNWVLALSGSN